MNIQIFGKPKCFDTKKAERFFKERHIRFQSIDLPTKGLSRRELQSVLQGIGGEVGHLLDEKHPDAALVRYLLPEAQIEKLLADPTLLRTPIVRNGQRATVGEAAQIWAQWVKEEA